MVTHHWNSSHKMKYRFETFRYGPESCPVCRSGPTRKGMSYTEEDRVDGDAASHRGPVD